MRIIWHVVSFLIVASTGRAEAVSVSGRFTTAAYSFQREVPESTSTSHFRIYQTGLLTFRNLGTPRLSFQTSLRTSQDVIHKAGNDPATRLQDAYFRWAGKGITLTGGRQFVSAGVGIATLDGGRARLRLRDLAFIDLYAGTLAGTSGVINGWNDGHIVGLHVGSGKALKTALGFSFYRRTRRVVPYMSSAGSAYADSLWADRAIQSGEFEVRPNSLEQQMIGLDVRREFPGWSAYGRVDLSTIARLEVRRGEATLRYSHLGLTVSGTFIHRTPWSAANSIFSIFTQGSNRELIGRCDYRFNRFLNLFGEFGGLLLDGRQGNRLTVGAGVLNGFASYTRRRGYGGVSDDLGADLRKRVAELLWLNAGVHVSRFRYEDGIGERSTVFSSMLGAHFRPTKNITLSLEGQDLAQDLKTPTRLNPFTGLRHDLRLFFTASVWFFHSGTRLAPASGDRRDK